MAASTRVAARLLRLSILSAAAARRRGLASAAWPPLPSSPPAHAYVHVPFCRRRCYYCDFPVSIVGDSDRAARAAVAGYLGPLLREVRAAAALETRTGTPPLRTLYIGGGTPSLAPPAAIGEIVRAVEDGFGLAQDAEVTLEMDPGTFDEEALVGYASVGVTRASVGMQSFDADRLAAAGRAHTREDGERAMAALLRARESGVLRSWSLDVIGGLPGETRASWKHTLTHAIASGADHVSVYDLTIEPQTAFGRWAERGTLAGLPADETSALLYRDAARELVSAGFEHYEVSNYARPGHRSRHNEAYWANRPCLAFGNGAASYVGGRRFSRPRSVREYAAWVAAYEAHGRDAQGPVQSTRDWLLETVMVALRTAAGLDLDALALTFGEPAARACARVLDDHSALVERTKGASDDGALGRARLTDPEGFLWSNGVIADAFAALDDVRDDELRGPPAASPDDQHSR